MTININSREYWEQRFSTGDWEGKNGRTQTRNFALGQIPHLGLPPDFKGTLLDFGCGLGDAMPVYRGHFPNARLLGMDVSAAAVEKCRQRYGQMAEFRQGGVDQVPPGLDVIIASNVLEHLDGDVEVVRTLREKCRDLFVVVPYREQPLYPEHVRAYDRGRFAAAGPCRTTVFACCGWSVYGWERWYRIYFLNLFRWLAGRPLRRRPLQILFHFKGSAAAGSGGGCPPGPAGARLS